MIETKLSVKEIERIIVSYLGGVRTNLSAEKYKTLRL